MMDVTDIIQYPKYIDMYIQMLGVSFGAKLAYDHGCEPVAHDEGGMYVIPDRLDETFSKHAYYLTAKFRKRGIPDKEIEIYIVNVFQITLRRIDDIACDRLPNTRLVGGYPAGLCHE